MKRNLISCLAALSAVAAGFLFVRAFPEWIPPLYVLSAALFAFAAGAVTWLFAAKKRLMKGAIAAASFLAAFFSLTYLINNVILRETQSDKSTAILSCLILLFFIIYYLILSRGKKRKRLLAACAILIPAIVVISYAVPICRPLILKMGLEKLYAPFRAVFSQGGVPTSDGDLFYNFTYPTVKVKPTDKLGSNGSFTVFTAKNETEGCQLTMRSGSAGKAFSLRISPAVNADGGTLPVRVCKECYLAIEGYGSVFSNEFPDPLAPYDGESVTLDKNRSQTFYIEFAAGADAAAGEYVSDVEILGPNGKTAAAAKITVTVWGFALPEKPSGATAVGLNGSLFPLAAGLPADFYGTNTWLSFYDGSSELTPEQEEVYKKYYDCLLEHKLCAFFLPYDLLDPRAEEYMNDPRVTAFCIPYPKEDDEKLVKYYEKVRSNSVWESKAYFYPVDEPFDADRVANYDAIVERLGRLCPGYHMVVPFGDYKVTDHNGVLRTATGMEEGAADILCPITDYLDDIRPWVNEREAKGDRLWWYVCCGPSDASGFCNLFTHQNALRHRILFWQQKAQNVTGFLYYETCNWGFAGDPWTNPITYGAAENTDEAGDGLLLYPGGRIGTTDPVTSLRLKCVRDGMEDLDLLAMAEELLGKEETHRLIRKVTKNMIKYTSDPAVFASVREEIGRRVAGLSASK